MLTGLPRGFLYYKALGVFQPWTRRVWRPTPGSRRFHDFPPFYQGVRSGFMLDPERPSREFHFSHPRLRAWRGIY